MTAGKPQLIPVAAVITFLLIFILSGLVVTWFLEHNADRQSGYQQASPIKNLPTTSATLQEPAPSHILRGSRLYVNASSNAARQAQKANSEQFNKLAKLPSSLWVTSNAGIGGVEPHIATAAKEGTMPVIVSYNFHKRDCGGYSSGGASSGDEFKSYIDALVKSIGNNRVTVIVEPDAIAQVSTEDHTGQPCLQDHEKDGRYLLLDYEVSKLGELPNTAVYLDAGNSRWITDTTDLANRLQRSGIEKADGFSLNISNFVPTDETANYGRALAAKLGNKHFVIDTSRNGLGTFDNAPVPTHSWCNPPGRALGHYPTTNTGQELIDAYLYIKYPGESDGTDPDYNKCFGGPKAGDWWPEYALGLIERWPKALQP